LARPPCSTNKDEDNVVIKIGCNIFAILSLTVTTRSAAEDCALRQTWHASCAAMQLRAAEEWAGVTRLKLKRLKVERVKVKWLKVERVKVERVKVERVKVERIRRAARAWRPLEGRPLS
jgi:hypothetical protein